jgi:hypothetical protein
VYTHTCHEWYCAHLQHTLSARRGLPAAIGMLASRPLGML